MDTGPQAALIEHLLGVECRARNLEFFMQFHLHDNNIMLFIGETEAQKAARV